MKGCKGKRVERGLGEMSKPHGDGFSCICRREQLGFAPGVEPGASLVSSPRAWGENTSPHPSLQEGPVARSEACLLKTEGWQAKMQWTQTH